MPHRVYDRLGRRGTLSRKVLCRGRVRRYLTGMAVVMSRRSLVALPLLTWARPSVAATLGFGTLYGPITAAGVQLTPQALALVGQRVTLPGFMAPPLKPEPDFFVLTRTPTSTCPFCTSGADWPVDSRCRSNPSSDLRCRQGRRPRQAGASRASPGSCDRPRTTRPSPAPETGPRCHAAPPRHAHAALQSKSARPHPLPGRLRRGSIALAQRSRPPSSRWDPVRLAAPAPARASQ